MFFQKLNICFGKESPSIWPLLLFNSRFDVVAGACIQFLITGN